MIMLYNTDVCDIGSYRLAACGQDIKYLRLPWSLDTSRNIQKYCIFQICYTNVGWGLAVEILDLVKPSNLLSLLTQKFGKLGRRDG